MARAYIPSAYLLLQAFDVAAAVAAISRHLETARQHLIGAETTE